MSDQIKILIQYTKIVGDQSFSDTIVLPQDQYNEMTSDQIESIKQERISNWLSVQEAMAAVVAEQTSAGE